MTIRRLSGLSGERPLRRPHNCPTVASLTAVAWTGRVSQPMSHLVGGFVERGTPPSAAPLVEMRPPSVAVACACHCPVAMETPVSSSQLVLGVSRPQGSKREVSAISGSPQNLPVGGTARRGGTTSHEGHDAVVSTGEQGRRPQGQPQGRGGAEAGWPGASALGGGQSQASTGWD